MAEKMSMCPEHMMKQCQGDKNVSGKERQGVTGPPQKMGAREASMQPETGNTSLRDAGRRKGK